MKLQQVLSYVRKAIDDYDMIQDGDKIAIGISGGKDSLCLLYALQALRRFYPKKFDIVAVTVDLGFNNLNLDKIKELCVNLNVEYEIVKTDIAKIVFDDRKETNPCSLCAKMRKGALNEAMKAVGCNKIAYAHHKDDIIETFLMSLIYEGRISCFQPVTNLDRTGIIQIRPMLYIHERTIDNFVTRQNLPVLHNRCPVDKYTKREEIKKLVYDLSATYPDLKERVFGAMQRLPLPEWEPHGRYKRPVDQE